MCYNKLSVNLLFFKNSRHRIFQIKAVLMRSTRYIRHQFFVQLISSKGSCEVQFGIHVKLSDVLNWQKPTWLSLYKVWCTHQTISEINVWKDGASSILYIYLVSFVQITYEFIWSEVSPATHKYASLAKHLQKADRTWKLRTWNHIALLCREHNKKSRNPYLKTKN